MIGVLDSVPKQCFHPQIPLKVANGSLALQIGTIPGRFGSGWSNSDYKASSVQLQLQLPTETELGKKPFLIQLIFDQKLFLIEHLFP